MEALIQYETPHTHTNAHANKHNGRNGTTKEGEFGQSKGQGRKSTKRHADPPFIFVACAFPLNRGPQDTPYEGGIFPATLTFPRDYPLSPPQMKFTCEMFHPNSKWPLFKQQKKTMEAHRQRNIQQGTCNQT